MGNKLAFNEDLKYSGYYTSNFNTLSAVGGDFWVLNTIIKQMQVKQITVKWFSFKYYLFLITKTYIILFC